MPTPVTSAARIRRATVASISAVVIVLPSRRVIEGGWPSMNSPPAMKVAIAVNSGLIHRIFTPIIILFKRSDEKSNLECGDLSPLLSRSLA